MRAVSVSALSFSYGASPVLHDVTFSLRHGEMLGVVGPNGSGKSTLISLVSGTSKPAEGGVEILGKPVETYSRLELSRRVAVVPQTTGTVFPFTVEEVVSMGRYPHLDWKGFFSSRDREVCSASMEMTGVTPFRKRTLDRLSAGERQRVFIARALSQEPEVLLLDEAASFLDIGQEVEIFRLLDTLRRNEGLTLMAVSHDLNLVGAFCQRVLLLREGRVQGEGALEETLRRRISPLFSVLTLKPANGAAAVSA